MESIAIIVLAGGKGTRMKQDLPKVLTSTIEQSLVCHVLDTAAELKPERLVVVSGYGREQVEDCCTTWAKTSNFSALRFAFQEQQLGTGDAARAALEQLSGFSGTIVVLYGDVPMLSPQLLRALLEKHDKEKATVTIVTLEGDSDNAYGRIIRQEDGAVARITEVKDCSPEELLIDETNSGIYAIDSAFFEPAVTGLTNENAQQEYYLTDIVERAATEGQTIATQVVRDPNEIQGVNDLLDLQQVNDALRKKIIDRHIKNGVSIQDRSSIYIDPQVELAPGCILGPNVVLKGSSKIAGGTTFEGNAHFCDTTVSENCLIRWGVRAEKATLGQGVTVGPFAHLRPGTNLKSDVRIGNFVEIKNSTLQQGAKANHLSYLGDTHVGEHANIGAGAITCNYDGFNKSETDIGKEAFIGSNCSLVAPLAIGDGAIIGAGSVVTCDVAADAVAVARPKLEQHPQQAKIYRERKAKQKK